MGKLVEEGMKAGWLLATEGCLPTALGARVRNLNGKVTVNGRRNEPGGRYQTRALRDRCAAGGVTGFETH